MRLSKKAHTRNKSFLGVPSDRKAQMEMIGLVIIVILITLGMLFLAQFALEEDPKKKIFTRKGLAYSTMSAVMKTTVSADDCVGKYGDIVSPQVEKDLLEDCAKNYNAPYLSLYNCRDGMSSCEFLEIFIEELLEETLGNWGKRYTFKVSLTQAEGENPLPLLEQIERGGGCLAKKRERDSSDLFPIHTEAGLVQGELFLCD